MCFRSFRCSFHTSFVFRIMIRRVIPINTFRRTVKPTPFKKPIMSEAISDYKAVASLVAVFFGVFALPYIVAMGLGIAEEVGDSWTAYRMRRQWERDEAWRKLTKVESKEQ